MKFCANVSILFKEVPLPERFARAKEAGFSAVEFWWPSGEDLGEIAAPTKDAGFIFDGKTSRIARYLALIAPNQSPLRPVERET